MKKLLLILFVTSLLMLAGCKTQDDVIKIGFMGPLTGDAASYGESIKRGVDLAKDKINLANVKIVYEDSRCEGKEAVNVVNKLINVDGVIAIVGEVCSGATLAAAPIAEQNKVVMISAASTSPDLSEAGDYIFRTVPSDALQGAFGAKLVHDMGHKKLAVLYSNEEYGVGFNKVLKDEFAKLGGWVIASEAVERGSVDLRAQITKIKSKQPDAVYLVSNSPDTAAASLKQLKELGVKAEVYGSEGFKSDAILESAGNSAEGLILTSVSSGSAAFIKEHKAKYDESPGPFAAQGHDAFEALAMALKAGATTGPEVQSALAGVTFDGASGVIVFDEQGDIEGNYDVYVVEDGAFVNKNPLALELSYTP